MIARLHGVLLEKHPPLLVVDVGGVGYELEAPMTTFIELPETGAAVTLFVHQVVREDAHPLFGFARRAERDVFRLLLRVSGVGAKVALAILSGMDAASFTRCIYAGDTQSLSKLPGIGKKTAERLVMEMRDRLDAPGAIAPAASGGAGAGAAAEPPADPVAEAVSALVALGLKPQEASRRVHAVDAAGLAPEAIVRLALQAMVR